MPDIETLRSEDYTYSKEGGMIFEEFFRYMRSAEDELLLEGEVFLEGPEAKKAADLISRSAPRVGPLESVNILLDGELVMPYARTIGYDKIAENEFYVYRKDQ